MHASYSAAFSRSLATMIGLSFAMLMPSLSNSLSESSMAQRRIRFGPASSLFHAAPVVMIESRTIFRSTRGAYFLRCARNGNSLHLPLWSFGR